MLPPVGSPDNDSSSSSSSSSSDRPVGRIAGRPVKINLIEREPSGGRLERAIKNIHDMNPLPLPSSRVASPNSSPNGSRSELKQDSPASDKSSGNEMPILPPDGKTPPSRESPRDIHSPISTSPKRTLLASSITRSHRRNSSSSIKISPPSSNNVSPTGSTPPPLLRSSTLNRSDSDGAAELSSESEQSSVSDSALSKTKSQVAVVLRRSLFGKRFSSLFISMPKDESKWSDTKFYTDSYIMGLQEQDFAKVPAYRLANMSSETLMKGTPEQFNVLEVDRLEAILTKHPSHFFSENFLNAIDLRKLDELNTRLVVWSLCPNVVFQKFTKERQIALDFYRKVYTTENLLPRMAFENITKLSAKMIASLKRESIANIGSEACQCLLNKHWEELKNEPNMETLITLLSQIKYVHHWLDLAPELVVFCTHHANLASTVKYPRRFLSKLEDRLRIRTFIRESICHYGDPAVLSPQEIFRILSLFFLKEEAGSWDSIRMNRVYFEEVRSMFKFSYMQIVTNLPTIGKHWCDLLPNKPINPFILLEPVEKIISLPSAERKFSMLPYEYVTKSASESASVTIGSLFPVNQKLPHLMVRTGDPVEDDIIYRKYDLGHENRLIIIAGANGLRKGEQNAMASSLTNNAFMESVVGEIMTGLTDYHILLKTLALGMYQANQTAIENKSSTTNIGVLAIRQNVAPKSGENWKVMVSSVGNMKLFRYSLSRKFCFEVTRGFHDFCLDLNDPGGRFGHHRRVDNDNPHYIDLRNFGLVCFNAADDDILIPMSIGMYEQMDPEFLKIAPYQAYRIILNSHYLDIKTIPQYNETDPRLERWVDNDECRWIRQVYAEIIAFNIIREAVMYQRNIATAFAEHALSKTYLLRKCLTYNACPLDPISDGKIKEPDVDQEQLLGRMDNFAVGAFKL